ncbi:unnamed protein product [Peronospora farinosa]|uniref:Uncharacterized protein n=1 Tax=Peronospora farinosa TaxID=134698 RepID=A0AAV0THS1_9STRA|nr:unnamed protein product [Peronospora farinosa]CAI5722141.1 unnamed protein product [Peronospora farinosa]
MEIQDILPTYDIKQFVFADAKSASRLVAHILNQVSRPTALTDAMLLVDAYSDLLLRDRAAVQIFCRNMIQYLQQSVKLRPITDFFFSVSVLRDSEKREMKLKQLMKPKMMFGEGHDDAETTRSISNISNTHLSRNRKGKKCAGVLSEHRLPVNAKRQRAHENGCSQPLDYACHRLQQDDGETRLVF